MGLAEIKAPGDRGADIKALDAWDIIIPPGSNNTIVAVIDTGVDYLHEDLAANIGLTPGEIPRITSLMTMPIILWMTTSASTPP